MKEFIDFQKELTEAFGEFGEIVKSNSIDFKNPDIQVKGVGRYKLEALKKNVAIKLQDLADQAKKGNFEFIHEMLAQKSILNHFVSAILEVERELQSPIMKRKATINRNKQEQKNEERELEKKIVNEVAPPDKDIELWLKKNKKNFVREYGTEKGIQVAYGTAWRMYNKKHGK